MKKQLLFLPLFLLAILGYSQESKKIDSTALFMLDKMSEHIGELEAVTFELNNSIDELDSIGNIVKQYSKSTVFLTGPDKLLIRTEGGESKTGIWYNGTYFSYYNFDENNYVTLEAPKTTMEMIDEMHLDYGFQFPAADFFYQSFTDDMIEQFDVISYLGKKTIDNEECYHIMATNKDINVQIWISNKTFLLPKHFVIIYKNKSNLQYKSTFQNWSFNTEMPESAFSFLPPPTAKLISVLKKS